MLQLPALLVSFALALAIATLFHLWKGTSVTHWLYYCLASVMGFACGQVAGQNLHVSPWTLGQVHVVEATAGAILFLVAAHWLRPQQKKP
jgi:hypothetical protein